MKINYEIYISPRLKTNFYIYTFITCIALIFLIIGGIPLTCILLTNIEPKVQLEFLNSLNGYFGGVYDVTGKTLDDGRGIAAILCFMILFLLVGIGAIGDWALKKLQ